MVIRTGVCSVCVFHLAAGFRVEVEQQRLEADATDGKNSETRWFWSNNAEEEQVEEADVNERVSRLWGSWSTDGGNDDEQAQLREIAGVAPEFAPEAVAMGDPGLPQTTGSNHHLELVSNELNREANLHLPPEVLSAPQGARIPLVVNIHAWAQDMNFQERKTGMSLIADREGFAVLYPQGYAVANTLDWMQLGIGYSFNAGACCANAPAQGIDDVQFMRDAVNFAADFVANLTNGRVRVDAERIYATGFSNGGFMTNRLGCQAADLFAAIAPVSGVLANGTNPFWGTDPYDCPVPRQPMPTLHMHGTGDLVMPYDPPSFMGMPRVDDYIALRKRLNGISSEAEGTVSFQTPGVTCTSWGEHASNVTLCALHNMGHSWPNSPAFGQCPPLGPTACSKEIDATEQIWQFFQNYRKVRRIVGEDHDEVRQRQVFEVDDDDAKHELRIISGDLERRANLHVPPQIWDAPQGTLMPLVVNLHAWAQDMNFQEQKTGMSTVADREGFAVLYPQGHAVANTLSWMNLGIGYSWNAGACCPNGNAHQINDVGFIRDAVSYTAGFLSNLTGGRVRVDPQRIFATGFSNGGFMANRLGCQASDLFAAIAPVAGVIGNGFHGHTSIIWEADPYECPAPSQPIPTLHMHGTGDAIVPYGGSTLMGFPSVEDYIALRRRLNGIPSEATGTVTFETSGGVTCTSWGEHANNVTLCSLAWKGHSWPGSPGFAQCPLLGPTACSREIDATEEIWQFFKGYRKNEAPDI